MGAAGPPVRPATVIGVAAGEVTAVRRSAESLAVHTRQPVPVVPLERAGAYGFNELIAQPADVLVLLEAGAIVGPRWLELLTATLTRPGVGLAGPSTNQAGNEQGCVVASGGVGPGPEVGGEQLKSVRLDAARLLRRYGSAARTLAPVYSLGDFCYAVRREVVDAIGLADPAYGPGWAMDYNIRAAHAGFAGLWVGGSYVCRTAPLPIPPPAAQQRNRGAASITLRLSAPPAHRAALAVSRSPLVSCVMPTRNRPEFAAQAVRYFLAQDTPTVN